MANLTGLSVVQPPIPIAPILPDFVLCDGAYGQGLSYSAAMQAGTRLPQGSVLVTYMVDDIEPVGIFHLPDQFSYGGVTITVDVAGRIDIQAIQLVPNDVRGMVGFAVTHCVKNRGVGGFVTKQIQGLVDFVTDPTSNLDHDTYPPSSAFVTALVSYPQTADSMPGDYDPNVAEFLQHMEEDTLMRVQPQYQDVIADRIFTYNAQATRMSRLGNVAWWDDVVARNGTEAEYVRLSNTTVAESTASSRRKRTRGVLSKQRLESF